MFSKLKILFFTLICFEFLTFVKAQNITITTNSIPNVTYSSSTTSTILDTSKTSTILDTSKTSTLLDTSTTFTTITTTNSTTTSDTTTLLSSITSSNTILPFTTVSQFFPSTTKLNLVQSTKKILQECSLSCEKCGINSKCIVECGIDLKECIFNNTECSTKCECKSGYDGKNCAEIQLNTTEIVKLTASTIPTSYLNEVTSQTFTSTQAILDENFETLKNKVWSEIYNYLTNAQHNEINANLIQTVLNKLNYLTYELVQSEKLEKYDIIMYSQILQAFNKQNPKKFFLTEDQILTLIKSFDEVLELNHKIYSKSNKIKSILEEANAVNGSSIAIYDCIDNLNRFYSSSFPSKSTKIYGKNFKMILSDKIKPGQDAFPFEINLVEKMDLIDKISIDERILKRKYENNSIRISFRIYFNKKLNDYNLSDVNSKRKEFYKNLERPKNFFYDLTLNENDDSDRIDDSYLISSNILSASIFVDNLSALTMPDNSIDFSKFVRIQFSINLKKLANFNEKSLKCVFWNSTSSKWSTQGCLTSQSESNYISNFAYKKVCYCNHLTNFALFFDVSEAPQFSILLSIISYIGVSISLTCYAMLIISRLDCCCLYKQGTKKNCMPTRSKTLHNLYLINSTCLFITNICFILLIFLKPNQKYICKLNAFFLQFFLLFSFCFSLGLAYQHFSRLVKVFNNYESKFVFKLSVFAFTYAGFFTICEIYFEHDANFNLTDICWLKKPFIYYFFIGPLSLLLIVSLIFYLFVVFKVLSIYGKNDFPGIEENSYNHTRVIVLLFFSFISLNLSWVFGLFIIFASYIDQHLKFYLEVLFCIFNSFHGFSLLTSQYLAHKYSKSGAYSNNSFTKTVFSQNSQKTKLSGTNSSSSDYVTVSGESQDFKPLNKSCTKNAKRNANNFKPNKSNIKGDSVKSQRPQFLEFTFGNYEMDSDSNPNFQTFQTHLPNFEINLVSSNNIGKKENLSSIFYEPFTSSV